MRTLRTLSLTLLMTAALSGLPPVAAQTPAQAQAPGPVIDQNAEVTKERLRQVFDNYPPTVRQVLRLDPSLLNKPEYLAPYPALAQFLGQHPEVMHNPAYFLGTANSNFEFSDRSRMIGAMSDMMMGILV